MLDVRRRIDAPAADVWALLSQPAEWPRWGLSIVGAVAPSPLGRGATGSVKTLLGFSLPFRIEAFDGEAMTWTWSVGGVRATAHSVEPIGSRACVATIGVPAWAAPYALVVWASLRRLEREARARARSR